MIDFEKLLNPEQLAAATASDGPLLVLAAAGTGKTRTLVHRVAYLVERGIPADQILLLTFTNRAAREMLSRAETLVGPQIGGLWSGTFHHVCARILRRYSQCLGYEKSFQIIDSDDAKSLLWQCVKSCVANPKEFPKKDIVMSLISRAANEQRTIESLAEDMQAKLAVDTGELVAVYKAYFARKQEMAVMDFDDLLVNALRLVEENAVVRETLQRQFRHVLIDEYQDTNLLQARFVDILAAQSRNIMAVGDDFQCIYTWRGANFQNIMAFPNRWEGCRIIKLERNYRSVPEVLSVANTVMKDVPDQFEKTLLATRESVGVMPQLWGMYNGHDQADAVLSIINHMHRSGYAWKDIAVLYRSHFNSIELQMTLKRNLIPHIITSGVGVFEQAHVKDVLAFLRICESTADSLSFYRLMGLLPGVGEKTAERIWKNVLHGAFNSANPADRAALMGALREKPRQYWAAIDALFDRYPGYHTAGTDSQIVIDFLSVFYDNYLERAYDDPEKRQEDIAEVATQIASADGGLVGFMEEVALMTNLDRDMSRHGEGVVDAMTLSSVHQAKGMEWPVVILLWLCDGMFPSARALEDGSLDEERRLFYVAVTRAKNELYLCVPRVRTLTDGGSFSCPRSVFLREIPQALVTERTWKSAPSFSRSYSF